MSGLKSLNTGTFFKDRQGLDSVSALLLFMTWWPATWAMLVSHNENLYYAYIAAFTGLAANKQWSSSRGANSNVDTEQLADGDVGTSSVTTASSTVVSKSLAKSKQPVRTSKKRPF